MIWYVFTPASSWWQLSWIPAASKINRHKGKKQQNNNKPPQKKHFVTSIYRLPGVWVGCCGLFLRTGVCVFGGVGSLGRNGGKSVHSMPYLLHMHLWAHVPQGIGRLAQDEKVCGSIPTAGRDGRSVGQILVPSRFYPPNSNGHLVERNVQNCGDWL